MLLLLLLRSCRGVTLWKRRNDEEAAKELRKAGEAGKLRGEEWWGEVMLPPFIPSSRCNSARHFFER